MSRADAERWARRSAYTAPLYHATSSDSAAAIRGTGFDLTIRRFGRYFGDGVYATPDLEIAQLYGALHGERTAILELRVNVRRMLQVSLVTSSRVGVVEQVVASVPDGFARFVDALRDLSVLMPNAYLRPAALTRVLVDSGYDALEVAESGFTPGVGGTQVIIYDPRRVVVVEG